MFQNTPLSRRLLLIAVLASLAIGVVAGSVFFVARQYNALLGHLTSDDLIRQEALSKSYIEFSEINSEVFKLLDSPPDSDKPGEIYLRGRHLIDRIDRLQAMNTAQNFGISPAEAGLVANLQKGLADYKNTAIIGLEMILADRDLRLLYTNRVAASYNGINHAFLKLMEHTRLTVTAEIKAESAAIQQRMFLLGALTTVLVAGLAGFILWLIRGMSRQFNHVERSLDRLRQGDTTEAVLPPAEDPAFTSLYRALAAFRETLDKLYRTDQALSEKNRALERQAEELAEARDAALRASEAKSQFLTNISHELRTPLNGIMGMAQLLADTPVNAEQRDMLNIVDQSSRDLYSLIEDLLDFAKIEQGGLKLMPIPFNLRDSVEDTVNLFAGVARAKDLALLRDIDPDVPARVIGDPLRLRQVLSNLIDNAIKYTESGRVTISARSRTDAEGVTQVHFSVSDTGIGIPEAVQHRIFDAFAQADGSSTRRYGGAGMGLTICQQLTRLMGGALWLESQPGQGSTFHFELPFEVVATEATQAVATPPVTAPLPKAETDLGQRILIVEDNPINQTLVKSILGKLGYRYTLAENGQEALAALDAAAFDLILMDCQMPVMDGYEASRAIRRREGGSGRHIPILAVTAHAMAGDRERCLEAGMDDYLAKPYRFEELKQKIGQLLGSTSQVAQD
ncbi:MAG: response regulator [Hydrogenophilaceae bacterium]|nr:response regulator [Hydrogenophilaceae bacterium]